MCNASVTETGSGSLSVTDNDTATVTLSGSTTAAEGGATGSLTATLTLRSEERRVGKEARDSRGMTLVGQPDYSSDTKSVSSGAVSGNTVTLTVTHADDGLRDGRVS